jgi:aspartate aminotransferase
MKLATSQTISGTGSLYLAGQALKYLYTQQSTPLPTVYIPEPTWSNHHLLFSSLGFECRTFQYYDAGTKSLDITSYLSTLRSAEPGSVIILHACAHNPTGLDPSIEQWKEIGSIVKERRLFPLFDAAYLGFNSGDYEKDAWAVRYFVLELGLDAAVCLSFAKNMGLYGKRLPVPSSCLVQCSCEGSCGELGLINELGERVGALILATPDEKSGTNTQSVLESLQRSVISNPPAFGARIAETVLSDDKLRGIWFEDLKTMSGRIQEMRRVLYEGLTRHCMCRPPLLLDTNLEMEHG